MTEQNRHGVLELAGVYLVLGLILLFQYSRAFGSEERFLFFALMLAYLWTMGLLVYAKLRFSLSLLEPLFMITALYEGIFVIKPMLDLRSGNMEEHGIPVLSGGGKATLLFAVGYTMMFFGYYTRQRMRFPGKRRQTGKGWEPDAQMIPWLYGAWSVTFLLCIGCMLSQGLSLRYIFSFGAEGIRSAGEGNTALLFLSNFGITLVVFWLMILEYTPGRLGKIVTTALCTLYILMRNARWLMLVFLLSPVILYYRKRGREPRLLPTLLAAIGALAVFAWMQANRGALASGGAMGGWGAGGFTLEKLLAPLESDLSTYRTFYAMVLKYPSDYPYLLGSTFLYGLILFVPRALWKGKTDNPVRDMIEHALNRQARASGTAVANIGECYANFGPVGVVILMYLFGRGAATLKRYCMEKTVGKGSIMEILYAVSDPLLFQWVARGNFSGNVYITLFAWIPALLLVHHLGKEKAV